MRVFKRIVSLSLAVALALTATSAFAASAAPDSFSIRSTVTKETKFTGKSVDGVAYVDFKGLLAILPYEVGSRRNWDPQTKSLFMLGDAYPGLETVTLSFADGNSYFSVDEEKIEMNAELFIVRDKMYFPLEPIASYYGLRVAWDAKKTAVTVSGAPARKLPLIVNTAKLEEDDRDTLVDLTNKLISAANDRDFKRYSATTDSKSAKPFQGNPVYTPWYDAAKGKLTIRRIDFVMYETDRSVPRVVANVKWNGREMSIAYFKREAGWTVASMD